MLSGGPPPPGSLLVMGDWLPSEEALRAHSPSSQGVGHQWVDLARGTKGGSTSKIGALLRGVFTPPPATTSTASSASGMNQGGARART